MGRSLTGTTLELQAAQARLKLGLSEFVNKRAEVDSRTKARLINEPTWMECNHNY